MPNQDLEHLRILSIFHDVVGGLAALFSLFALPHFLMGAAIVTGACDVDDPSAGFVGWFFMALAGAFILMGWAFAGCLIASGRFLASQRNYLFCLVMGGVACIFMPFGTVLGVFTIIILVRESVKNLFNGRTPTLEGP